MTERKEKRGSTEMVDLEMYLTTGEKKSFFQLCFCSCDEIQTTKTSLERQDFIWLICPDELTDHH